MPDPASCGKVKIFTNISINGDHTSLENELNEWLAKHRDRIRTHEINVSCSQGLNTLNEFASTCIIVVSYDELPLHS